MWVDRSIVLFRPKLNFSCIYHNITGPLYMQICACVCCVIGFYFFIFIFFWSLKLKICVRKYILRSWKSNQLYWWIFLYFVYACQIYYLNWKSDFYLELFHAMMQTSRNLNNKMNNIVDFDVLILSYLYCGVALKDANKTSMYTLSYTRIV